MRRFPDLERGAYLENNGLGVVIVKFQNLADLTGKGSYQLLLV